jgi:hypothetical protein
MPMTKCLGMSWWALQKHKVSTKYITLIKDMYDNVFYRSLFSPSFSLLFCSFFFDHVVSSLAYPNLLRNKRLSCCC